MKMTLKIPLQLSSLIKNNPWVYKYKYKYKYYIYNIGTAFNVG
jgi:hypothetical protein